MNIIVTGGAGFIGREVCRQLLEAEHRVEVLDNFTYAADGVALDELQNIYRDRLNVIACDVRSDCYVRQRLEVFKPEHVLHLAAESHVDRSISGPQSFLDANVQGTYGVLEAIRAYGVDKTVMTHVSTDEVFGELPLQGKGKFDEYSPYAPNSPYSASKAASNHLVRAWGHTFGVRYRITYGANTYGPGQLPDKLVPMAIVNGLLGLPITIHGDGLNVRSWMHVTDHAAGIIAAAFKGRNGRAYCLEDGFELGNQRVVQEVCAMLFIGAGIRDAHRLIRHVEDRPGNDMRYSMDSARARAEIGFNPTISFQQGLLDSVEWYKRRYVK